MERREVRLTYEVPEVITYSGDELLDERHVSVCDLPPAVAQCAVHDGDGSRTGNGTQGPRSKTSDRGPQAAPRGSDLRPARIAVPQQQLQLMRLQRLRRTETLGPPTKFPSRQTLVHHPKSLTVVDQESNRRGSPVAKNEDRPAERVSRQHLPAEPGQTVNPATEIRRLHRQQNAHLGCDLNHAPPTRKLRVRATRSPGATPMSGPP